MSLVEFLAELDGLLEQATAAFSSAADATAVEAARVQFVGARSGRLKDVQKGLGAIDKADKPAAGKRFNEIKQQIEAALEAAVERLSKQGAAKSTSSEFDPTIPGVRPRLGHLHPLTQTTEELKDIMGRLGFTVAEGPEVEDPWHNFEALNIPREHPARDPLENFYLATAKINSGATVQLSPQQTPQQIPQQTPVGMAVALPSLAKPQAAEEENCLLLRSQTSTVQIRVMEKTRPPVRIISVGRVYRPDTADATHYPMFHQIEGLLVDRQVTMADLKSVLRLFARSAFADDVHIRFRPSFFPFTEPSVEVDMSWNGGWIEMGGAGMVDPNVLKAVGYDPDEYTGFAFGLGVERITARRHNVTDIREFYKNDVRFLHQF
ncbi:MAG: phenylalanine--tRNA ligase subunit alpha [Pirellulales bacterium]|nr:phenylalanine--tRNA ligase subunit alpha [Pirellulales bacterium]